MKNYIKTLNWAVCNFVSRKTQDDNKDKLYVCAVFACKMVADEFLVPNLPNQEIKRYVIDIDKLEKFEEFYNFVNDIKEDYPYNWESHLQDKEFTKEEFDLFTYTLSI